MKNVRLFVSLLAFGFAFSTALAFRAVEPFTVMKDGIATSACPLGVLNQAEGNCDNNDHSKGRCTVTVTGGSNAGTWDAFSSTDGSCQNALYKIN